MIIRNLVIAIAMSLVLVGVVGPAGAVPADKGSASRDCVGADVRATRADPDLCAVKALAQRNGVAKAETNVPRGHGSDRQRWAPVVMVGATIAAAMTVLLRRSFLTSRSVRSSPKSAARTSTRAFPSDRR
jgi:hypothetical protein